jgi:hypothetical protein
MVTETESDTNMHRVGPFDVRNSATELILRLENRGELSGKGCALFAVTMTTVMILGFLSIIQTVDTGANFTDPTQAFTPTQNHFGFLWVFSSVLMLVLIPLYVVKAYRSALVFAFRKSDNTFRRDNRVITKLNRIEHISVCETKDPDARYLYMLHLVYGDGYEMLLHNGYDEREVLNLANEISAFVGCRVVWD